MRACGEHRGGTQSLVNIEAGYAASAKADLTADAICDSNVEFVRRELSFA